MQLNVFITNSTPHPEPTGWPTEVRGQDENHSANSKKQAASWVAENRYDKLGLLQPVSVQWDLDTDK